MAENMKNFLEKRKSALKTEVIIPKPELVVEEEDKLVVTEKDAKVLRLYINEDISIPVLVSLVLSDKIKKPIKESHLYDLQLREFVDSEGVILEKGKLYLEKDETKARIKELLES